MKKVKVFGLGFHRSGTTSLQTALEELGFSVVGMRDSDWQAYENEDFSAILDTVREFDGFRDMPWPLLFEWLDSNIKDAKFILTYRDPVDWTKSCSNFFRSRSYRMFDSIYGFDEFAGNESTAVARYLFHIDQVREYFKDRPGRYLEVCWQDGDGWAEICSFLDEPIPSRPFPRANRGAYSVLKRIGRKMIYRFLPYYYRRSVRDK